MSNLQCVLHYKYNIPLHFPLCLGIARKRTNCVGVNVKLHLCTSFMKKLRTLSNDCYQLPTTQSSLQIFSSKQTTIMNWTASKRSQKESDKCCQPKKMELFACTCAGCFPSELLPTDIQGDNRERVLKVIPSRSSLRIKRNYIGRQGWSTSKQ